jgi:hypothetical protein
MKVSHPKWAREDPPPSRASAADKTIDEWIAEQWLEFAARDDGLVTDGPMVPLPRRLQSPERPPSNQCRDRGPVDEDDDWGPWTAGSAVAGSACRLRVLQVPRLRALPAAAPRLRALPAPAPRLRALPAPAPRLRALAVLARKPKPNTMVA